MMRKFPLFVTASILLMTCGCAVSKSYNSSSAATPEAERVVLECNGKCGVIENLDTEAKIDARYTDRFFYVEEAGEVVLDPGQYNVSYLSWVNPNPELIDGTPDGYQWVRAILEAGHTYSLEVETDVDWFGDNDVTYGWIVDKATGKVVAGTPLPKS